MSEQAHIHQCEHIGLTMGAVTITEVNNAHGQHYWKATEKIGSIFGHEVEGEIEAIGTTREACLERLRNERDKLAGSLWF